MDDLKRVGLVFKADGAVDFKKSIKEVSAAVKENYSEFKLAQSQWDKSTKATEKLEARQKYLTNQTSLYTQKVEILNEELKEMESAENKDTAAIERKKTEINNTQAKLNEYDKTLQEINKDLKYHTSQMQEVSKKWNEAGGKITDVGKGMSTVSAGVVAAGTASVAAFNEVDEALDQVAVKTGASGKALADMENIAKDIATTIPTSFENASEAVGEVNTRFNVTGDQLKDLSTRFVKFAELNKTDVSSSIDNVQKVMQAYKIKTEDAGLVLDMMNTVGQKTGISMDTLASSLVSNAASMQEMGFNAAEAATFLGQCEVSGIDTTVVMSGLKKALTNAAKEGKALPEALADFQRTMDSGASSTDKLNAAVDLFGAKAGGAIYNACANGSLSLETLKTTLDSTKGSVSNTYETTLDGADKLTLAANEAKIVAADIGKSLGETLAPMLQDIIEAMKEINEKWNNMSPVQQQSILTIAMIVAAIGPLLIIIGKMSTGVGALIALATKLIPIIIGINPVVLAVIAVIALLVAGGVSLYENWDTIKENCVSIWGSIKDTVSGVVDSIIGFFNKIIDFVKNNWQSLLLFIVNPFAGAFSLLYNNCDTFRNFINTFVERIKDLFNFQFRWPHIPMPHFAIRPQGWKVADLLQGSIPNLSVQFYKEGALLNRPTLFGMNGNKGMVGGEAGAEAVLPVEKLIDFMRIVNGEQNNELMKMMCQAMYDGMKRALKELGINIVLNDEKVGEVFASYLRKELFE